MDGIEELLHQSFLHGSGMIVIAGALVRGRSAIENHGHEEEGDGRGVFAMMESIV